MPIVYPQGNPETNTHYRTLSEIRMHALFPEASEIIIEKQIDYKTRFKTDGKPIFNRDRLS